MFDAAAETAVPPRPPPREISHHTAEIRRYRRRFHTPRHAVTIYAYRELLMPRRYAETRANIIQRWPSHIDIYVTTPLRLRRRHADALKAAAAMPGGRR